MKLTQWLLELFRDERGAVSVKPVIGVFGALTLMIALAINILSFKSIAPDGNLIDAIVVITIAGMTGDSIDKFSFLKKKGPDETQTPPPEV